MRRLTIFAVLCLLPFAAVPRVGAAPAAPAATDKVATVGGRTITRAELEEHVRPQLIELESQRYDVLREGLDEMVAEELIKQEAKARGTTPAALEKEEIEAKVTAPTDAEIQKVYDENKEEIGDATIEQLRPRIVEFLKQQQTAARRAQFLEELKKKHATKIALSAPVVEVATAGRPEKGGGAKAPITIVTFSDYQCPFCKRGEGVIDEVVKAYGDKVRVVFRDYPLPMHPQARNAAEAANCANAQGKFWEYHDKLFANQSALCDDKLKEYAQALGLDAKKFDQCLADKPYKAAIDKDMADGAKAGVNGTPAFFINGRMLSGAQPLEKFKEVIDAELASGKAASTS